MKNQVREFLLKLAESGYNLRWVQAITIFEDGREVISFYDTQTDADLGKIEIIEPLEMEITDLVRGVKYPLLDAETLSKHLTGLKRVAPKYNKYKTFYEGIVLNSITLGDYDINTDKMSDFDKIAEIYTIFTAEYLHHNNRDSDQKVLFKDWIQGLPTVLTIPYMNFDILEQGIKAGFDLDTEAKEDKFLDEYWQNTANAFFTLYESL